MADDDSDSDLDDIAYVGDEDDERGPGCLIGLSIALSVAGFVILLIATIYAWSIGLFDGFGALNPGVFLGYSALMVASVVTIFVGGAAIGTSLFAMKQAHRAHRAELLTYTRIAFGLAIAITAFGMMLAAFLVVIIFRQ